MSIESICRFTDKVNKVVPNGQGKDEYIKALKRLNGPSHWILLREFNRIVLNDQERATYLASIQKEVVESWTEDDLKDMKITREQMENELQFTSRIVPLAEEYSKSVARKKSACERLNTVWGADWKEKMGDLLPGLLGETFLRGLAVFAEKTP